jgi:DEAD/DEAH box helicase domain-containing protein
MQDPVGTFDTIRDNFIRYVRTAFFIRNSVLDQERKEILEDPDSMALYRIPWIEPIPRYRSTATNFGDLPLSDLAEEAQRHNLQLPDAFSEVVFAKFKDLVSRGLFPADRPLYRHQFEMMVRAICGESVVITAGTGSGKTESFLLPIFARLVLESARSGSWSQDVDQGVPMFPERDTWWNDRPNARAGQRLGEPVGRSGVRALLLYPMNALVEDQMSRLRKALDSGAYGPAGARDWFAHNLGEGQRIYFGRYNGSTPVPGHEQKPNGSLNSGKIGDLKRQLREASQVFAKARDYDREHNSGREEVRFFFPSVDGAEMRSRWDMQDAPPDILVTNFSMLSIMLMRDADTAVFETTKAWLESDPENNVFHLVIDELHLYRGTAGTEVAYLVRLLLHRLGLSPDSPQLRILASSASLEQEDVGSQRFVKEFFGREGIGILPGALESVPDLDGSLALQPFVNLAKAWERGMAQGMKNGELENHLADAYQGAAIAFGGEGVNGRGIEKLVNVLSDAQLVPAISNTLLGALKKEGRLLAASLEEFGRRIFGLSENHARGEVLIAVKGLLIARAAIESWPGAAVVGRSDALPSFRLHWFFRNLEGLWASPDPSDDGSATSGGNAGERPVGRLFPNNRKIITPAGNRPLELLYCEQCGEVMLGGIKLVGDPHDQFDLSLLCGDPDLESVPDKPIVTLTQDKSYSDYGVFWPSHLLQPSSQCPELPAGNATEQNRLNAVRNAWGPNAVIYEAAAVDGVVLPSHAIAGWSPCKLDAKTGQIHPEHEQREGLIQGFLYRTGHVHNRSVLPLDIGMAEKYPAFPAVCPCCGEDYRFSSFNGYQLIRKKSPIRTFRTGFTKISQTFAKELFHVLPTEGQGANDRKLIVFSDSREDAAKIANDIERFHFEDMMRDALYTELRIAVLGKGEFANALFNNQSPTSIAGRFRERFPEAAAQLEQKAVDYRRLKGIGEDHRSEEQNDEYGDLRQVLRNAARMAQDGRVPLATLYEDIVNNLPNVPLLIQRLRSLGLNPAGLNKAFQRYTVEVKDPGTGRMKKVDAEWWQMFDFDGQDVFRVYRDPKCGAVFDRAVMDQQDFRKFVRQNILGQVFGKLYFGFESSGLGYPCIRADDGVLNQKIAASGLHGNGFGPTRLREVCNTVLRLFGEKFHYEQVRPRFGNPPVPVNETFGSGPFGRHGKFAAVVGFCQSVADKFGFSLANLEQAIRDVVTIDNPGWILQAGALDLQLASDDHGVWRCGHCQRIHLHGSAGVCSHCLNPLPDEANGRCEEIWQDHYYASTTARDRAPFRLHTEELTGQTDDQAERQRHFRNIVLEGDGEPRVKVIDLLSVTTTMEVGIDIGDLRAVMQANMPPERFNYQQRAGRGGRRGQSYSVVMTLCRQRSHDTLHFEDPTAITTGKAPTPFLAMDHLDIARRIMAKGLLRRLFVDIGVEWCDGPASPPDSHGELGYAVAGVDEDGNPVFGWQQRRQLVLDWVANSHQWLERLAVALSVGFNGSEVTKASLLNFAEQDLVGLIDQIASNPELSNYLGLAERLAEGALLPMFGMPSKVRVLYHGRDGGWRNCRDVPSIDRELDLAVTEFAPGAQKTKDKRIHKSAGVCPDLYLLGGRLRSRSDQPFTYSAWMSRCTRCHFVASQPLGNNVQQSQNCPTCGATASEGFMEFEVRTPAAFYTDRLKGGADAREDGEIISPPAARLADGGADALQEVHGLNFKKQFRPDARLFTLNDNRGELFHGTPVQDNETRGSRFPNDEVVTRWLASDANSGQLEQIGLVAPKTTNVLTFRLSDVPSGIEVSPIRPLPTVVGNQPEVFVRPGVKSALNSAAFLIRSVAADALDIDPEEFDICHIRLASLGIDPTGTERYSGEFVISDHLANGSGFTRWLDQNLADHVIGKIIRAANDAFAGRPLTLDSHGEFLCRLFDDSHRHKCDWSCYSCLRNFRNMRFHPLLDWRLATSMIRMLADSGEQVGLDGNWDKVEIDGWFDSTWESVDSFLASFRNGAPQPFEKIGDAECPAFRFGDKAVVVRHPLWDTKNPEGVFAEAFATLQQAVGGKGVLTVDSFDLVRRPSWVFQRLVSNPAVFNP